MAARPGTLPSRTLLIFGQQGRISVRILFGYYTKHLPNRQAIFLALSVAYYRAYIAIWHADCLFAKNRGGFTHVLAHLGHERSIL